MSEKESLNELNSNQELKINMQMYSLIYSRLCAVSPGGMLHIVEPDGCWISETSTATADLLELLNIRL